MLDIARIHAYRKTNNEFFIFDVPRWEAKRKKKELERDGFTCPHTELV